MAKFRSQHVTSPTLGRGFTRLSAVYVCLEKAKKKSEAATTAQLFYAGRSTSQAGHPLLLLRWAGTGLRARRPIGTYSFPMHIHTDAHIRSPSLGSDSGEKNNAESPCRVAVGKHFRRNVSRASLPLPYHHYHHPPLPHPFVWEQIFS